MNTNLLFDFSVNKENNTIKVVREFDAALPLVWRAWTTAELLEKWWAPQPFTVKTKSFDFSEGGLWHYAMVGPEGETHWCRVDYQSIDPEKDIVSLDAFCDEEGRINTDFSPMQWHKTFTETGVRTRVDITIAIESLETLETIISMGFQQGFTMGLDQLDALLQNLS